MSSLNPEAAPFLPAIASLSTLPDPALISTLDLLFEPAPELHTLALPTMRALSFASYNELIDTLRDQLLTIAKAGGTDPEVVGPLHAILGSHPRLGEKKKNTLSAQSAQEQKQLQGGDSSEAERLAALNHEYEDRFPGLRYVVFVNGRSREVIMEDMKQRIERADIRAEEREAIEVSRSHSGELAVR
jgi:2-oxo-4-hydroxy-4-carboxy--5-ureidoimidazoline (OHCU) decarboxylase